MKKYFLFLFLVLVLVLLPFEVTIQAQDIETYPVLESKRVPVLNTLDTATGEYGQYMTINISIVQDGEVPSERISSRFGIEKYDDTTEVWVMTLDICRNDEGFLSYEPYIIIKEYAPTDIDEDGDTDFKDLWLVLMKLLGGML